jgi:hypothetical protein
MQQENQSTLPLCNRKINQYQQNWGWSIRDAAHSVPRGARWVKLGARVLKYQYCAHSL